MKKRVFLLLMVAFVLLGAVSSFAGGKKEAAAEDAYPSRPIKVYVPYSAGGSSDLLIRSVNAVADKYFDQPLVVVNKSGGGGTIATEYIVNQKPDGYSLLHAYGSGCDTVTPNLQKLPYDPLEDIRAVCRLSIHTIDLVVHADSEFKTVDDLVAYAKKKGSLTVVGSTSAGSQHITAAAFGEAAGININFVPFGGGGPAAAALVGKQGDCHFGHPSTLIPHLESGSFRLLASGSEERDPVFPDTPTLMELGYDVYTIGSVKGIGVPKDTPDYIVNYLAEKFKLVCEDKTFQKMMKSIGQPIMYQGPEEFAKFLADGQKQYGDMINRLGLKP